MTTRRLTNRGFTLTEVMIVAAMTSLLAILFTAAWKGLGQPSADALVRCQIAQEAHLAVTSLAADLGGSLPNNPTGTRQNGRLFAPLPVGGTQLRLCYDRDSDGVADWGAPDTVITYFVDADPDIGNRLIRWNENTGDQFYVASNVESMAVLNLTGGVQIALTFTFRGESRTYTLIAEDP